MSDEWNEARLQAYLDSQTPESLTLDYKAPAALARDSAKIAELCKDVSSFANSAGGILIYGMHEDKTVRPPAPKQLEGITDPKITGEWIDQILASRIQQRVDGYRIFEVPLRAGGVAYVITVPQATTRAPHQAPDHRYYKRFEFHAEPMEDYEVRDARSRAESPELYLSLALPQSMVALRQVRGTAMAEGINLLVTIGNRAYEPAPYAAITVDVDERLWVSIAPTPFHGNEQQRRWKNLGIRELDVHGRTYRVNRLSRNYGHAGELPLFFDNPEVLEGPIVFGTTGETVHFSPNVPFFFYVGWSVKAPRMAEQSGAAWLYLINSGLRLRPFDDGPTS